MALEIRRGDERNRTIAGQVNSGTDAPRISETQHQAFDAALSQSVRSARRSRDNAGTEIGRISKPRRTSAGIFDLVQSQELLAYLIRDVLPHLDLDEEVAAIARSMLSEEIDYRRDIQDRLTEAQDQ